MSAQLQRYAESEQYHQGKRKHEQQVNPAQRCERGRVFGDMRQSVLLQNRDIRKDPVKYGEKEQDDGCADCVSGEYFDSAFLFVAEISQKKEHIRGAVKPVQAFGGASENITRARRADGQERREIRFGNGKQQKNANADGKHRHREIGDPSDAAQSFGAGIQTHGDERNKTQKRWYVLIKNLQNESALFENGKQGGKEKIKGKKEI